MTQKPATQPSSVSGLAPPNQITGTATPAARAAIAGTVSFRVKLRAGMLRQAVCMPTPSSSTSGSMGIKKTTLKYGGPTEILPMPRASRNNGYRVPNSTPPAAATSRMLLSSSSASRDRSLNPPLAASPGARQPYNTRADPVITPSSIRMNRPRAGSDAKACTETSTPERTRNVPSRLRLKAAIAKRMVQLLNRPRFSVTARECISAVPTSQGMNEAFSTGSQNHQPPQPSS